MFFIQFCFNAYVIWPSPAQESKGLRMRREDVELQATCLPTRSHKILHAWEIQAVARMWGWNPVGDISQAMMSFTEAVDSFCHTQSHGFSAKALNWSNFLCWDTTLDGVFLWKKWPETVSPGAWSKAGYKTEVGTMRESTFSNEKIGVEKQDFDHVDRRCLSDCLYKTLSTGDLVGWERKSDTYTLWPWDLQIHDQSCATVPALDAQHFSPFRSRG